MKDLLEIQRNEITEHFVYRKLSHLVKNQSHKNILLKISEEELSHYNILKSITTKDVKANKLKIFFYVSISKFFGLNFGLKLMEKNENGAASIYSNYSNPQLAKLMESEKEHENKIISMIDEEVLNYVSSIVLGLNDALVELTGALTGFTFALSNSKIVAIVGFITGMAASLSMGVSNYLSVKNDLDRRKHPFKSAVYTFLAYFLTVSLLITPYILISNPYLALSLVFVIVIMIIAFFNFYNSVSRGFSFKKNFFEMIFLSMSVALINYAIGYLIRRNFNVDI